MFTYLLIIWLSFLSVDNGDVTVNQISESNDLTIEIIPQIEDAISAEAKIICPSFSDKRLIIPEDLKKFHEWWKSKKDSQNYFPSKRYRRKVQPDFKESKIIIKEPEPWEEFSMIVIEPREDIDYKMIIIPRDRGEEHYGEPFKHKKHFYYPKDDTHRKRSKPKSRMNKYSIIK